MTRKLTTKQKRELLYLREINKKNKEKLKAYKNDRVWFCKKAQEAISQLTKAQTVINSFISAKRAQENAADMLTKYIIREMK